MSFDPASVIRNSQSVVDIFGYWPSFHDGEIITMRFKSLDATIGLDLRIYGFSFGPDLDKDGAYALHNRCVVDFAFRDVTDIDVRFSYYWPTIFDFSVERIAEQFRVSIESVADDRLPFMFTCRSIEVIQAQRLTDGAKADWVD